MTTSQRLLRRLIDQSGGAAQSGYVLVIDGEGLEDLPPQIPTPTDTYTVHRASTELGLRHLLWKAQGAPLIVVLPETLAQKIQAAPDLLRRARNQRVHALAVNDVLEVVLGVRVVGADAPHMQQLALEHLEPLGLAMSQRTLPTVIDRRLLTELLVDASVGEQVRTRSPAELLAAWTMSPPRWSENVSRLVREALPTLHGDEGRLLSWALEQPEERLRALVVHGAVLTVEGDVGKPAWGPLWQAAAVSPVEMDRRVMRQTLCRLATDAIAAAPEASSAWLAAADALGRDCLTPAVLQTSRVLPLAFQDLGHTLATRAAKGGLISIDEIGRLESHSAAAMFRPELAVLTALARLTRFLAIEASDAPETTDVVADVISYQKDGAFAELALSQLRRALSGTAQHHTEAGAVIAAVRARRDMANRRFAERLGAGGASGYEAGLHRDGLVPLHRVWKRVVQPVWQKEPGAKIYVALLDGCSYAVFLELLHALSQDAAFPMGIRPDEQGQVAGLPALSPLPTITSHARGAFFLGELPSDPLVAETVFRDQDEARTDKARFSQNAALGSRPRKLFLKGDLTDGGQALVQALASDELDVVAAVFNAVDDQIGSSNTGATVRLAPEDIVGFKASLRAAVKAGRRILLTADHGHSPFVDKGLRVGVGKAPRYLSLGGGEPVPEGFIELDLGGLGGPPERRAFAWKSGVYLGGAQVGFHGGASLEEMVVPLAWLDKDGLQADEPAWWFGRTTVPQTVTATPAAPPFFTPIPSDPPPRTTRAPEQLSLLSPASTAGSLPVPVDVLDALTADQKTILVLLRDTGAARATELATKLNKNPGRLNGLMRSLRRTLHEAGVVLFVDEVLPNGETLYRYSVAQTRVREVDP